MSDEQLHVKVQYAAQDTAVAQRARAAFDAWVASKLHEQSTDVEGVTLERDEVAYCAIEGTVLVEPGPAGTANVTDAGRLVVTSQRCVFVGSTGSTEWPYSKLLGYSLDDQAVAMFDVSGQPTCGVRYGAEVEPRIDATIAAAIARSRGEEEHAALVHHFEQEYRRAHDAWEQAGVHSPPTS